jgi:hypothetical protein
MDCKLCTYDISVIDSKSVAKIPRSFMYSTNILGYAVAQLAEAPRYQPEGRGFDS